MQIRMSNDEILMLNLKAMTMTADRYLSGNFFALSFVIRHSSFSRR
jgi:hypothetical protein